MADKGRKMADDRWINGRQKLEKDQTVGGQRRERADKSGKSSTTMDKWQRQKNGRQSRDKGGRCQTPQIDRI